MVPDAFCEAAADALRQHGHPTNSIEGRPLMVRCRPTLSCLVAALFLTLAARTAVAEEYSQAKLQSFANAVLAVNAIVEQWRPQIQGASSEADRQRMAEQANEEMRAAVEGTDGMTVEEYQAIAQAAQADPQLMARLDQVFKDMAPAAQ
jgi:hypothetical protein